MITAAEAKELTLSSDSGLKEFLEDLESAIQEAAEEGHFEVEFDTEDQVEPFVLKQAVMILKEAGYTIEELEIPKSEYTESFTGGHKWVDPGLKINWRLA